MNNRLIVRRYLAVAGAVSALALGALTSSGLAQVATNASAFERFEASRPDSKQVIEYRVIDSALASLVIGNSNTSEVRYDAIKGDGERLLTQLVSGFATIDPTQLNSDEQLAYWLNLRALLVLRSAAQAFPGAKPEKLLAPGSTFYTTKAVKISGVDLSIGDIDALILKRSAANPNVIYGLALPVHEAPAFPTKAYRGATVNAALDAAARAFINRSGAIKADADAAKVPQFLIGYRDRLGGNDDAVLAHIRGLATPKLGQKLMMATRLSVDPRLSLNSFAERSFADRTAFGGISGGSGAAAGS
ncbi:MULTISPECIES: DUF547 domain-containing protein [Sphingomonas]|uniref:DUF547 domain-containing protein n=1 Tax=Sphingomonas TaxID=13687 RepID=UPI0008352246|nr:DUF547 domain-containing protein [Sphingomonas sp. CCH10-B3]MBA3879302.1 DUF547 domain-containing protein [Sphingobium sp.]